ncbi:Prostaglandin reductase 1 [Eumeta japonica]|uniref:Prostaglandin reductase 1 n=1 Tax=Eumeta variegata TaxID=151549 RepID=A0A4C1VF06_EUMVA|nr:Prostaglandin reductase 1 [Eumeta japonica]
MVRARKYVVNKRFEGMPKKTDFEIVAFDIPSLKNGDILVKAEYISVDPYLRAFNKELPAPYDQFGYQVGRVLESKNPKYPPGTLVVSHKGWCDHTVLNEDSIETVSDRFYKVPELNGLPSSLGVGAVGMPGATAFFGLLELCKPQAGETLVVSGAAGAVGSLVGQIGKLRGLHVIGFAGSDDKVRWLTQELGFDRAYNYRSVDVASALREAAPNGVDCYFDNVGGEFSSIVLAHMNEYGRVACCGSISAYNADVSKTPTAPIVQPAIVGKQLTIHGFMVNRWRDRWPEAFSQIVQWIKTGKLKPREHITEGFDKIVDAFVGMLAGENYGKAVVKETNIHGHKRLDFLRGCFVLKDFVFVLAMYEQIRKELPLSFLLVLLEGKLRSKRAPSPLSEHAFAPWLGASARALAVRQAPTAAALLYTTAVVGECVDPYFMLIYVALIRFRAQKVFNGTLRITEPPLFVCLSACPSVYRSQTENSLSYCLRAIRCVSPFTLFNPNLILAFEFDPCGLGCGINKDSFLNSQLVLEVRLWLEVGRLVWSRWQRRGLAGVLELRDKTRSGNIEDDSGVRNEDNTNTTQSVELGSYVY